MLILLRKVFIIILLISPFTFVVSASHKPSVSASSAVLIDADTFEVLYQKEAHKARSMASTTKIMTSLIAIESGKLNSEVTIKEKPYIEGTAIGFEKGDCLTLKNLCYAMLLESGNDAAVVTAEYISGSEKKFSTLMNKKADELGMKNTSFVTASGLDDENHYTTAYDMALLGAHAVKNDIFREICSTKSYKAEFITPQKTRYFSNHNRLLTSCDGVIGVKTGFTKKSGRCLVSACERNGKLLVAVTLNAPDDWNDHKKLYDYGYSLYSDYNLKTIIPASLRVVGSHKLRVSLKIEEKPAIKVLSDAVIVEKLYINKSLYAPVEMNDAVGKIVVYQNGKSIYEYPIAVSEEAVVIENSRIYSPSITEKIKKYINKLFKGR